MINNNVPPRKPKLLSLRIGPFWAILFALVGIPIILAGVGSFVTLPFEVIALVTIVVAPVVSIGLVVIDVVHSRRPH